MRGFGRGRQVKIKNYQEFVMGTTSTRINEIYLREIRQLSTSDQLLLAQEIIAQAAVATRSVDSSPPQRSLLELEGMGADCWEGMDAQEYVDQLRAEWS